MESGQYRAHGGVLMTCIVGVVAKGSVYIGADTLGASGYDVTVRKDEKVFKRGEFLIGFTSSYRMGQLLRYALNVPAQHPDTDIYEYMVTTFIDTVRGCLKDGGYARKEEEAEKGGCFLVGYKGRLFKIESDYQVGESVKPYDATGCGEQYALGAFHATGNKVMTEPEASIRKALEAAAEFSAGVRGPFVVMKA
jgi:ATP-dependent protease HslVU (ClpYQ) peptidase subunit